jgi:hypothetical protein
MRKPIQKSIQNAASANKYLTDVDTNLTEINKKSIQKVNTNATLAYKI